MSQSNQNNYNFWCWLRDYFGGLVFAIFCFAIFAWIYQHATACEDAAWHISERPYDCNPKATMKIDGNVIMCICKK